MGTPEWVLDWLQEQGQSFPRQWFADETPQRSVTLSSYQIDRYPVTVAQFKRFINATNYVTDAEKNGYGLLYTENYWEPISGACWSQPAGIEASAVLRDDHPVVHISWNDAVAYATWAGKRLPEEAEWELAARGHEYRLWPWGNDWVPSYANTAEAHTDLSSLGSWQSWWNRICQQTGPVPQTTSVHKLEEKGSSVFGVVDMAGNVYEWTNSICRIYGDRSQCDPILLRTEGAYRVIRGGSWMNFRYQVRCGERIYGDPTGWSNFATGFRCAKSLNEERK